MAGYIRTDTTNNIADGNIINAVDLDNEFDGIQAAFNSSTGHNHDGTTGEGSPILVLGPMQDVVVGTATITPKTNNTVDIGSTSLKFKDLFLAGNASVGGTLAITGVATLTAQPVLSSLTASSAVATDTLKGLVSVANTGSGNNVLSNSPTLVTPILGTPQSGTVTNLTGTASININGTVGATTANTGAFTTLTASTNINSTRINPRTLNQTSVATLTPDISVDDQFNLTAQAVALTVAAPNGTPVDGNKLIIRILDNGTPRAITWNATYTVIGTTLPTTTTASKMLYVGCIYNSTNTRWDVVAVTTQV